MSSVYEQRPWLKFYPEWVTPDLETPCAHGVEMFRASARAHPAAPLLHYFEHTLTFAEVDRASHALPAAFVERGLTPDDVAVLSYTSGTTGRPKGAMNTHGNIVFNSEVYRVWMQLGQGDVVLGAAPLFHITGLIAHLGVTMLAGLPLVLFYRFDPAEALRLIERWKCTFTVASITAFLALMEHPDIKTRDLATLCKVYSGGAPIAPAVTQRFQERTGAYIHNIYGLTETNSPSHAVPLGTRAPVDPLSGALSVGVPVPNCEAKIVDLA